MLKTIRPEKLVSLILILAIHCGLLYGLWSYKLIPSPKEEVTLFVNLITSPPPKNEIPPPPKPLKLEPQKVKLVEPKPVDLPKPESLLVSDATVSSASEPVAPPPPIEPVIETPLASEPVAPPSPPAALMMSDELSLACPQRPSPDYPAMSRRQNEQGRVVLRVELDETGRIANARVAESSGYKRLDESGLTAIKRWQCNAAKRNGVAVRGIAMQPFDFILEGR